MIVASFQLRKVADKSDTFELEVIVRGQHHTKAGFASLEQVIEFIELNAHRWLSDVNTGAPWTGE